LSALRCRYPRTYTKSFEAAVGDISRKMHSFFVKEREKVDLRQSFDEDKSVDLIELAF